MHKDRDSAPDAGALHQPGDPWTDDDRLIQAFALVHRELQNPETRSEALKKLRAVYRRNEHIKIEHKRLKAERDRLINQPAQPDESDLMAKAFATIRRQSAVLHQLEGAIAALEGEGQLLKQELAEARKRNEELTQALTDALTDSLGWLRERFRELQVRQHQSAIYNARTAEEQARALREVTQADSTAWAQIERQLQDDS